MSNPTNNESGICLVCGEPAKIDQKYKSLVFYKKTCGKIECRSKLASKQSSQRVKRLRSSGRVPFVGKV